MFLHKGACPDFQAQSSYPKMPTGQFHFQVSQSECRKMNRGGGCGSVVKPLPIIIKAIGLVSSTIKGRKKQRKKGRKEGRREGGKEWKETFKKYSHFKLYGGTSCSLSCPSLSPSGPVCSLMSPWSSP